MRKAREPTSPPGPLTSTAFTGNPDNHVNNNPSHPRSAGSATRHRPRTQGAQEKHCTKHLTWKTLPRLRPRPLVLQSPVLPDCLQSHRAETSGQPNSIPCYRPPDRAGHQRVRCRCCTAVSCSPYPATAPKAERPHHAGLDAERLRPDRPRWIGNSHGLLRRSETQAT